jgi:hypothetical protein
MTTTDHWAVAGYEPALSIDITEDSSRFCGTEGGPSAPPVCDFEKSQDLLTFSAHHRASLSPAPDLT